MRPNFFSRIGRTICAGMCIGAADIVPGISGGTVAFILGIYPKLLESISSFTRAHLQFLLPLLCGISLSFFFFASFICSLLHHETYRIFLYAAFMGLVVGSAVLCARTVSFSLKTVTCFFFGLIAAYFLTSSQIVPEETLYDVPMSVEAVPSCRNVDVDSKMIVGVRESVVQAMVAKKLLLQGDTIQRHDTKEAVKISAQFEGNRPSIDPWIVMCGMIAISAMLLPGISGSYMLQVLGVYALMLGSLVDWVDGIKQGHFDWQAFRLLCSLGLGIVVGAIVFSRFVRYLLRSKREIAVSCLVGFMLGSLKTVWPFWSYSYELIATHQKNGPQLVVVDPILPQVLSWDCFGAGTIFLFGVGIVLGIEYVAHQKKWKEV